ncbi:hypothetical protein T07_2696 [Trichinella nelsoni]|uniref:Uncharacterized protein n=1 Tax=Trichinella nelsoni TaxID=6336 RepID=A0A0V0RZV2_9BILA|nr:hypothetical protein T07_2696 [Trichinella nelsoni]
MQVEEATSRTAVKCVLNAQYAAAHRAQVPSEDALPYKGVLEAALQEWWSLVKEATMTRIDAATFLNEEEAGDASQQKPQLKENSPPKSDGDIMQLNRFGTNLRRVHLREELSNITKLHYLRSCLSGPALKATEGVTVCALLKNRFHRLQDVVESHGCSRG